MREKIITRGWRPPEGDPEAQTVFAQWEGFAQNLPGFEAVDEIHLNTNGFPEETKLTLANGVVVVLGAPYVLSGEKMSNYLARQVSVLLPTGLSDSYCQIYKL